MAEIVLPAKTGASLNRNSVEQWLPFARKQSDRFWSHVDRSGECWLWLRGTDKDGYGKFQVSLPRLAGKQKQAHVRAHRLAYMLANGPIDDRLLILHSCDTPACCRPDHLRPGDQLANRADSVARHRTARGERHAMARLTESQAREVIQLRKSGARAEDIATRFGIGVSTVYQIGTLHWRHIA